jgi:hypothetical protein
MLTFDDLTAKTNRWIVPKSVDIVYKNSPVLTRLRTQNAERFEGGRSIMHGIMYAKLKGGPFGRGATFDTSYVQTDTALEVVPKFYYVNITLYGTDNVLNRGPMAAMSTVETKMVNAAGRMAELLGTDMYLDGQGTDSWTDSTPRSTTEPTSRPTRTSRARTSRPARTSASTRTTRTSVVRWRCRTCRRPTARRGSAASTST